MKLENASVSIIGLGLIGGSLALALRDRCGRLVGVDTDQDARHWAVDRAFPAEVTADLKQALSGCDLAILALPVEAILAVLSRLGHDLPSPGSVLDVGSTKRAVVQAMNQLPPDVGAVAGHPFAGKETSGPRDADACLFCGRPFALVPTERTSEEGWDLAEQVVAALGAETWVIDADEHDRRVACTSQLPFVLALSLLAVGDKRAAIDLSFWNAAASGFFDTSRLASSGIPMMRDILHTNRFEVTLALDETVGWLQQFSERLASEDMKWIETQHTHLRQLRQTLAPANPEAGAIHENNDLWPGA